MRLRISRESVVLAIICTLDMVSTAFLVRFRLAAEQNPLMAACLDRGLLFFFAVKLLSFVPFIVLVERYRRRNPAFVRAATRAAIVLYLCVYAVLFARANLTMWGSVVTVTSVRHPGAGALNQGAPARNPVVLAGLQTEQSGLQYAYMLAPARVSRSSGFWGEVL